MTICCMIVDLMLQRLEIIVLNNLSKRFKINYIIIVIIIELTLQHYFITFTRITFTVILELFWQQPGIHPNTVHVQFIKRILITG